MAATGKEQTGLTAPNTDEDAEWSPLPEGEVWEKHTDFPPDEQYLTCWLYRQEGSDHLSPYTNADHAEFTQVMRNLLRTLGELAQSKNKKLRERRFTVWAGDPHYLILGIPGDSPLPLKQFMHDRMGRVAGYELSEGTEASQSAMAPTARYEAGKIILYDYPSLAGLVSAHDNDNYKSGVTVHYRAKGPLWMSGGLARYQG